MKWVLPKRIKVDNDTRKRKLIVLVFDAADSNHFRLVFHLFASWTPAVVQRMDALVLYREVELVNVESVAAKQQATQRQALVAPQEQTYKGRFVRMWSHIAAPIGGIVGT